MRTFALSLLSAIFAVQLFADGRVIRAKEPIADEYIVVLKDTSVIGTSVAAIASDAALRHGARVLGVMTHGVKAFGLSCPAVAAEAITHDPRVAMVEENAIGHISLNSESYPGRAIWHLNRIIQRAALPPLPFYTTYMWTADGGASALHNPVAVYVVDSGVQAAHTEFSNGNLGQGANYSTGDGYTETNPWAVSVTSTSVDTGPQLRQ